MPVDSWIRSHSARHLGPAAITSPNHGRANKRAALKRFKATYSALQLEHLEERAYLTAVALLAADEPFWAADVQTKLESTGLFTSVTPIDVRFLTPTLAELNAYDGVLVWNNYPFADPTALGDNLADYVDAGHGVVVATFANTNSFSAPLLGRWSSGGYDVIAPSDSQGFNQLSLGDVAQPGHPIMTGVTNFDGGPGSWHSLGGLTVGSTLIASWSDGSPLVAEKSNLNIGLNFFPPSSDSYSEGWVSSTDGALLLGNALNYVTGFSARAITPAGGEVVFSQPTDFVIDLSASYDPTSVDVSDLTVNGITPTSVDQTDPNTLTFRYAVSPVTSQGLQTMHMVAGSVTALDSGELVKELNATFRYDGLLMQVTSTNPANTSVVLLPFTTLDLNFNEAYAFSSVQASDFSVNQGGVSGVSQVDADTLRLTLSGVVAEGTLTVNMAAAAITDVYGNPGAVYSGSYTLDFGTAAFPTPLHAVAPAGSLIYDGSQVGFIDPAGDSDTFSILVDPGQKITVTVDPASTLKPIVELYRDNALIGSATAGSAGLEAVLQTVASHGQLGVMGPGPKTYLVVVRGASGTTGAYSVSTILNAAVENENHDGASNNTRATAQSLEPSFLSFSASVTSSQSSAYPGRGAVLGRHDEFTATTVFSADFESEDHGFTVDNGPLPGHFPGLWHYSEGRGAQPGHSTSHSFYYGLGEGPDGGGTINLGTDTRTPTAGSLISPSMVLPTGGPLQVEFNYVLGRRQFAGDVDSVLLQVDDGSGWVTLKTYTEDRFDWTAESVDLSAYAGRTVQLRWQFDTVRGPRGQFPEGWYVDDINVVKYTPVADYYSFGLRAGESATLALKGAGMTLTFENPAGVTVASGSTSATNVDSIISDFVAASAGTYYVRAVGTNLAGTNYSLVVTRNAGYDTEDNNDFATAQEILATTESARQRVLGHVAGDGSISTTVIDSFDDGNISEYTSLGANNASATAAAAHDGPFGLEVRDFTEWMYRDDVVVQQGDVISVWVQSSDFLGGRTYFAFGATSSGALSMVMAPNTGELTLQRNAGYGFLTIGAVPQAWLADHWYRFEITWEANGDIAGNLFDSDGTTLLNTVTANDTTVTSGGIGFRSFGSVKFFDTVTAFQGTTSDFYQVTLAGGQPFEVETSTPAGGLGEFQNHLDPAIRVYNSAGILVASDDNSAPDRRNARLTYGVPRGAGGTYYVEVASSSATEQLTSGEYILSVKGNVAGRAQFLDAAPLAGKPAVNSLSDLDLKNAFDRAVNYWRTAGVDTTALSSIEVYSDDLVDSMLGHAFNDVIIIDSNAAGYGWAVGSAGSTGNVDLYSTVVHEVGHLLGFEHLDDLEVMRPTVAIGAKIVSPFLAPAVVNPASLGMLAKEEIISSMDGYHAPVGQRMSMNDLASLDATLGLLGLGLTDDSAADLWLETEGNDVDDHLSALNPRAKIRLLDEFFAELLDIGT